MNAEPYMMPSELWYRPRRCVGARSATKAAALGAPNISPKLQTVTASAIPKTDRKMPNPANPSPVSTMPSATIRVRGYRMATAVTASSKTTTRIPFKPWRSLYTLLPRPRSRTQSGKVE